MKKAVVLLMLLGTLFVPKICKADMLGNIFGTLFPTDLTTKYYSEAREQWRIFFANPGVTPVMSPAALADFNAHIDLTVHKVENRYSDKWEKANRNEWEIMAQLNREAKSTWDSIVQCAGGDTDKARNIYLNMQLCPDSKQQLVHLKTALDDFLNSSDMEVPSSTKTDLNSWLYSGGIQFHPLLIQLALEDVAIGFRYPDLAKCVSPCNPWVNGPYDVEWWKPWSQHREAPFWRKIRGPELDKGWGSITGAGFHVETMNRMDPDVRRFIRAVHAIMMINLLRRNKDHVCVQWGLWPQFTNILMNAISGVANIHGLGWDGYTFLSVNVPQECQYTWSPPLIASRLMVEVIDAQAWSAMAAFHEQQLNITD